MESRPHLVEALFGFRRDCTLALFPPGGLVVEGVVPTPDDDGAVRCRFAGQAATLIRATDTLWLSLRPLALALPSLVSELVRRTSPSTARAMLDATLLLEPMSSDRLRELILAHEIHAKDLHLLGDAARAHAGLGAPLRFVLRLPTGVLELTYTEAAYRAAHEIPASALVLPALDVEVRWKGRPVALDRDVGWTETDLAELAVLAHAVIGERPDAVLALFEAVLTDAVLADDALAADVRATLVSFWAVVLRRAGRLDEAVAMATRALAIAEGEPRLEQEILYNRGYARLQTTMKSRVGADGREVALFTSTFDVDPKHRATWRACLADFERALALDPRDRSAASQVDLTKKLLALLDVGPGSGGAGRPARPRAAASAASAASAVSAVSAATGAAAPERPLWAGFLPLVVVAVLVAAVLGTVLGERRDRSRPPEPPPSTAPRAPSARELSESARLAQLGDADALLAYVPGTDPCPLSVALPTRVPEGEVVAPQLGRGIGTGELYGTEYFDATVRNYAMQYAPHADALALRTPVGPLHETGPRTPDLFFPTGPYQVTVLVSAWRDPAILGDGEALIPGEISARLLVWSYAETRFACGTTERVVENGPGLVIVRSPYDLAAPEDDPLNRARLDLFEQALRQGIPQLTAL